MAKQTLLKEPSTNAASEAESEAIAQEEAPATPTDTRREELRRVCEACADILKATESTAESFREEERRFFYVTPASYLGFLEGVEFECEEQWSLRLKQKAQYALGLRKLHAASEQVFEMQTQLELLQPELLRASDETQQLMEALTVKQEQANSTKVRCFAAERSGAPSRTVVGLSRAKQRRLKLT